MNKSPNKHGLKYQQFPSKDHKLLFVHFNVNFSPNFDEKLHPAVLFNHCFIIIFIIIIVIVKLHSKLNRIRRTVILEIASREKMIKNYITSVFQFCCLHCIFLLVKNPMTSTFL